MTAEEWLLSAAKRAHRYFDAKARGQYHGDQEDLLVGNELSNAIAAVEQARQRDELVSRR